MGRPWPLWPLRFRRPCKVIGNQNISHKQASHDDNNNCFCGSRLLC